MTGIRMRKAGKQERNRLTQATITRLRSSVVLAKFSRNPCRLSKAPFGQHMTTIHRSASPAHSVLFGTIDSVNRLILSDAVSSQTYYGLVQEDAEHFGQNRLAYEAIGELDVITGTLLIADPMFCSEPVRVEGLPSGRFKTHSWVIHYSDGGAMVAKIGTVRPGPIYWRREIGTVAVDSAASSSSMSGPQWKPGRKSALSESGSQAH